MSTLFKNKECSIRLTLLLLFMFFSTLAIAQPGWQDYTGRYFYNFIDESGKEISFKQNEDYSIMIDSMLYKAPFIPQDSLKPAIEGSFHFENQIRINDFSLAIPTKSIYDVPKPLQIRIIYKKDTMYVHQSSGRGGFRLIDFQGKSIKPTPDYTLQFIAGHYFFPDWTMNLLDNLPKTGGKIKILNIDQRHFIIPKAIYNSIFYSGKYKNIDRYIEEAETLVVANFMKGNFSLTRSIQPTTFNKSVKPFSKPHWSSRNKTHYFTKDMEEYLGVVSFSHDTLNWSGGRGMLVRFNTVQNKMDIWSPTENLLYSTTTDLYHDSFNAIHYNRSLIRDSNCKQIIYTCEYENQFYKSKDKGKTWKEHKALTKLYKELEFRTLNFLDKKHALVFKLNKIKLKDKKYEIQQGTYYLLKNFRITDSLKTPDDIHYNGNYSGHHYQSNNDTIFLGSWTYSKYAEMGKSYYQPYIIKTENKWNFKIDQKTYLRSKPKPQEADSINYQNFNIRDKELLFKDRGSLVFKEDLSALHRKGLILENGKEIYLIGLEIGTLLSFDGGNSWLVYPLPLEKNSAYEFLEIDKDGLISHIKNSWGKNGFEFSKIYNQFKKLNL